MKDRSIPNPLPESDRPEGSAGEKLRAAHAEAQRIREESLAYIDSDPEMTARVDMALLVLEPIERFVLAYEPQNDDERMSQMLLVRFTNFLQGSREMALQGFYQVALANIRDANLTGQLLTFFGEYPDQIEPWRNSEKSDRTGGGNFTPSKILKALGKEDKVGQIRGAIYGALSDNATHPKFGSYRLLTSDPAGGSIHPGAFFHASKLKMVITALIHAVLDMRNALLRLFPNRPDHLNIVLAENRAKVESGTKYIADNFTSLPPSENE
jgi:hypothetical protein